MRPAPTIHVPPCSSPLKIDDEAAASADEAEDSADDAAPLAESSAEEAAPAAWSTADDAAPARLEAVSLASLLLELESSPQAAKASADTSTAAEIVARADERRGLMTTVLCFRGVRATVQPTRARTPHPDRVSGARVRAGASICAMAERTATPTDGLTLLGRTVREPVPHVECFPAPAGINLVRFTTDELASMCPVTSQPDLSHVVIEYEPDARCVESKSLKLYLWGFRDRAVFAEALAVEIADEIMETAAPRRVTVTLTQRPRGGITVEAVAERRLGG